jgi:uncharacterized repeat protein (TIGR01451 family)
MQQNNTLLRAVGQFLTRQMLSFSFLAILFFANSTLSAQTYGYGDVIPAPGSYASALNGFVASAPNPDIPSSKLCRDLKITFVLDESGSIAISNATELVKTGVRALGNALLNSGAKLRIVEFSRQSRVIDLGLSDVNNTFISRLNEYLGAGYNGQNYDPFDATNWDDALEDVQEFDADLVFFFTDGYPTAYNGAGGIAIVQGGSATFPAALDAAVSRANIVKAQGKHMFVVGVGAGIDLDNIIAISGPDRFGGPNTVLNADFSTPPFDQLASNLAAVVNTICGTELSILKTTSDDAVCAGQSVTFTTTVKNTGGSFNYIANNVEITDVYPDGFSNIQIISPATGATVNGQTVTYALDSLTSGQSVTLVVSATVDAPPGNFNNTVTATAFNANTVTAEAFILSGYATETIDQTGCGAVTINGTTYNVTGTYTQTLVSSIGCDSILTINVTINQPSSATEDITICNRYDWNGVVYTTSGTYTFTGVNAAGCDSTVTLNLTILNSPGRGTVSGPLKVCRNQSGFVYTVTPVSGATSYTWTLPTGLSGTSTSNTISVSANATFCAGAISVSANNECGSGAPASINVGVITSLPATPACITGASRICTPGTYTYSVSAVANATEYVWSVSGTGLSIVSGQGTRTITVSGSAAFSSGTLSVRAKNCFGQSCSARSLSVRRQRSGCGTHKGGLIMDDEMPLTSIFPNPAKENFNVRFETHENEKVGIMLMDNSGKVKLRSEQVYPEGSQVKSINTSGLAKGTYFIKITKNGKSEKTLSVVVQ